MGGGGVTTTALAALDIALWDLTAKEVGKSLVALLGPVRERVLAYASGINLNKSEPELALQVRGWRAAGFKAFKIKIGKPEIEEDVERLTKVREVAGRLPVMVDANQGWDIGRAERAIHALEPQGPYWIEEPLLADDVEGHARLRARVRTPIAIGENVYTLQQFNHFLARGACDFVQADVVRVGGITPYLEIAALARAFGVPLAPHFMMELSGQLLCCLPHGHILESIDGGSLTDLGALSEPIRIEDGHFTPARAPRPRHRLRPRHTRRPRGRRLSSRSPSRGFLEQIRKCHSREPLHAPPTDKTDLRSASALETLKRSLTPRIGRSSLSSTIFGRVVPQGISRAFIMTCGIMDADYSRTCSRA
jgi:L-alanine-DL-glutamate epimerase-like enolase superfamily enzyme